MRILLPCLSLVMLAACQPPVPDDRIGGVGFENYAEYQARRMAEAQQRGYAPVQTVQGPVQDGSIPFPQTTTANPGTGAPTAAELAQAGVSGASALVNTQQPSTQGYAQQATTYPQTATAAPAVTPSNPGISDEQDFSAVSSRESIESDKQRIAQNRAQYQQIQPTELPQRTGKAIGPKLIEYALSAPNRLGESIYKRSGALGSTERACARYATPEEAQQVFLNSGGPKRDPKNLDPDGDGFACFWDPTPFQKARG